MTPEHLTAMDIAPTIHAGTQAMRTARKWRDDCVRCARQHGWQGVQQARWGEMDRAADQWRRARQWFSEARRWHRHAKGEFELEDVACD